MHIIFETPRLVLRRITEADSENILLLNSHPDVVKYVHEEPLNDIEKARKIIVDIILPQYENNLGRWSMITKDSNAFIGWCGLKFRADRNEIDLGFRLMIDQWGKGYATEAATHTLAHGFNKLDLDTIVGRAHVDNAASLRVLEKIGMKFLKQEVVDDCPVKTYTLNKEQYSKSL